MRNSRFWVVGLLLFNLTAAAEDLAPTWLKIPLQAHTVLKDGIYAHSFADSVMVQFGRKSSLPPVQHIERISHEAFDHDVRALIRQISHNLAIDKGHPMRLRAGPFKGGPSRDLAGKFIEYQSTDRDGINYVTCMAFVKSGSRIHAVYVESFLTALPKCSESLIELSASPVMYRHQ